MKKILIGISIALAVFAVYAFVGSLEYNTITHKAPVRHLETRCLNYGGAVSCDYYYPDK